MFVHCANISRSKSKLRSICNSVHVCHLLSAGNPAPQADGGSPYIVHSSNIQHLPSEHCPHNYIRIIFICGFKARSSTGFPPKTDCWGIKEAEKRSQFLSKSILSSSLVIRRRGLYYGHLVMCQPTTSGGLPPQMHSSCWNGNGKGLGEPGIGKEGTNNCRPPQSSPVFPPSPPCLIHD